MKLGNQTIVATVAVAFGVACSGMPDQDHSVTANSECPVISSQDWRAWHDRAFADGVRTLNVRGTITLSNPAYRSQWRLGPLDRRRNPGQRLILSFAPDKATNLPATRVVRYSGRALASTYSEVVVVCGEQALVTIYDVGDSE